jgi:hypothetical protein
VLKGGTSTEDKSGGSFDGDHKDDEEEHVVGDDLGTILSERESEIIWLVDEHVLSLENGLT